ncbi:MAG: hypothetical protein HKN70_02030, partial [Gammaproteobacteria bacterium]|nr:hypothetical protein [Gammaproteobacteria bacterium]
IVASAPSGVTLATGGPNLSVIEYDDMQPAPAGSTSNRIDFVALVSGRLNDLDNQFELIYAYDNIVGDWSGATIGVENADGSAGTSYTGPLSDGLVICWDYREQPTDPTLLSFDVKVQPSASGGTVEAQVFNVVDMPGAAEVLETLSLDVATSDSDNDGISDELDNCAYTANPEQVDADMDGFGNMCDGDFNQDMIINFRDVVMMMGAFGTADAAIDINTDGVVGHEDIEIFKTMWLSEPGPSGVR